MLGLSHDEAVTTPVTPITLVVIQKLRNKYCLRHGNTLKVLNIYFYL